MAELKVKPGDGYLLVNFLDEEEDEEKGLAPSAFPASAPTPSHESACLAQVVAAGAKTTSKVGAVVYVRSWARGGLEIAGACLVSQYDVVATIQ